MKRIQVVGLAVAIAVVGFTAVIIAVPSVLGRPACGGGVYDAQVSAPVSTDLGQPIYNLTFTRGGVQEHGLYYGYTSGAISWIRSNTPSNAVFMSWWDYGKEIAGCTGRSSVISNPSARFIALGFSGNQAERDPEQSLVDVGTALFTTNATLARSTAARYGAGFLLVTVEDGGAKAPYVLRFLGLVPADYISSNSTAFSSAGWTALGRQTVIYRLSAGESVPGFTLAYSDSDVRIYTVG